MRSIAFVPRLLNILARLARQDVGHDALLQPHHTDRLRLYRVESHAYKLCQYGPEWR